MARTFSRSEESKLNVSVLAQDKTVDDRAGREKYRGICTLLRYITQYSTLFLIGSEHSSLSSLLARFD